jgi:hypothetical protein
MKPCKTPPTRGLVAVVIHVVFCIFIFSQPAHALPQGILTSPHRFSDDEGHTSRKAVRDRLIAPSYPIASVSRTLSNGVVVWSPSRTRSKSETSAFWSSAKWRLRAVSLGLAICLISGPLLFAVVGTRVWEALQGQERSRRLLLSLLMPLSLWLTVCLLILTLLSL